MSGALKRDEWETVRLGDVCDVNMGQSPDSKTYNSSGVGLPFYQGNADFGLISPSATSWCSEPKKTAHKDDILISVLSLTPDKEYKTIPPCCLENITFTSIDDSILDGNS